MEGMDFDRFIRARAAGTSRRGVIAGLGRGLAGIASVALVGSLSAVSVDARGKKKQKKQTKKRRKKGSGSPSVPAGPSSPPPATGPGSCPVVNAGAFEFTKNRVAQTFLPPQGGQLTEATIYLVDNPSLSLIFEIRKVNAAGEPTNTVLASEIVSGIQATDITTDPPRAVTATFASPAILTLGQPYALSVRATNELYYIATGGGPGDGCPDGKMFRDEFGIGDFVELAEGTDMAFDVKIV